MKHEKSEIKTIQSTKNHVNKLTNAPNTVFNGQLHTRYRQNILAYHYQLKCTANFVYKFCTKTSIEMHSVE